jgi:putative ABC transport system substrate-binding protein
MSTRRDFISPIGGAAAWPLAASGQQPARVRRIGVLMNLASTDPESPARLAVFLEELQKLGWTEGRNIRIDTRWGAGVPENFRKYAAELVALAPDVILAVGSPGVAAVQQITRTLPIVFVNVADPIGSGFVASLPRPGGNATGFTRFEYGMSAKWLELLRQIAPRVTRAAVVRDPAIPSAIGQ